MSKLTYKLLSDCVRSLSGGTPSKSNDSFWAGDLPWVSSGEMGQSRITDTELHITQEAGENHSKIVPAGTVLVVVRGMSLAKEFRVSITQREMAFNQDLKALIVKENVNSLFLFYSLYGRRFEICKLASESAHGTKKLDTKVLDSIPVFLPALPTQQKIAAIVSAYDELIENNDRRIALLEKMAEEIYREWFVRLRFPGFDRATFHKGIPEGWEMVRIEELSQVVKRGVSPNYDDLSNLLVINQRCIRDGNIDLSVARRHNTKVPKEKFIKYGDVLINSTGVGTLGRISIVGFEPENITVDSHVTICRADEKKISKQFLAHSVKRLQEYFELMAVGATGQVELSRALIINTQILVPPLEIQEKYSFLADKIWLQKNSLSNTVCNLKQTRDRLLTRLTSGKLSVEDLDIQFPPSMTTDA